MCPRTSPRSRLERRSLRLSHGVSTVGSTDDRSPWQRDPSTGTGLGRAFLAETVVTFILVWVVVSVGSNPKASPAISAVAIGFALAAAIFIAGPVSGGAVNPARALGPMLVSGKFTDWWIYLGRASPWGRCRRWPLSRVGRDERERSNGEVAVRT